ncbi:ester cyclase [Flavihumibacter fluvii]|uniref:ester cyclase n=1 Tax=Flavihumibacter fluvii TaxID=2838157 RepID=UPI001BDE5930|nr:ester cyclase [Flavihumibacter fluvii]ULQ51766.1 ester cyclase [Flavihumibacter fluvii]
MTTKYYSVFSVVIALLFSFSHSSSFGQNTSSPDANRKIVISYFDEVINKGKLNRMGEFFSQDYIWHQMNGTDIHSSHDSAHIAMIRSVYSAIPDIRYTIDNIVAEGDMIAVNSTVTGTANSVMFGLSGGQKKVQFKQMFFFRLANNKITEEWEVVDVDGMKAQLAK